MKEARFISRNKDKWKNMENGQQPDAEHLAANFIELSDDLAYARTFYPGSEVERYLNQLIAGYQTDMVFLETRIAFTVGQRIQNLTFCLFLFRVVGFCRGIFSCSR